MRKDVVTFLQAFAVDGSSENVFDTVNAAFTDELPTTKKLLNWVFKIATVGDTLLPSERYTCKKLYIGWIYRRRLDGDGLEMRFWQAFVGVTDEGSDRVNLTGGLGSKTVKTCERESVKLSDTKYVGEG